MIGQSKAKEGLQEVSWGGVIKPWHQHRLDAIDMAVSGVQQRMMRDAGQGQWVPVVHGGEMKWRDDEYACSLTAKQFEEHLAMDEETREMCGLPRVWEDKKLRVQNPKTGVWERQQIETYLPPTLDAQAKVLSALAPETFGDKRRIDLNVSGGLGVSVIGTAIKPPQHLLDIEPAVEAITDQTDAEDAEVVEYQQPEATMSEPFTPDPNSPLTEEQQRILHRSRSPSPLAQELASRAAQKLAEVPAPAVQKPIQPPPPPSSNRFDDQDDCVQRQPRGMKVI
jgi:hypothetical protein